MASLIQPGKTKAQLIFQLFTQKNKFYGLISTAATRNLSTENNNNNNKNINEIVGKKEKTIKKSVFISQSYDIFTNLALEDWIYNNFDLKNHHILMLWANNPTVVIGRHQNPFSEANIKNLTKNNIEFARRNSGGGTVYHDRGNLNCSFFTPRDRYNRKYNLNLITRALYREWGIKADISDRDDILLQGKKISGTAAKLGHSNSYHHCTLLVNSNKLHLTEALDKEKLEIQSNATKSVRAPIRNICDANRHVNVPQLLSAIGYEFLRTSATELYDGGRELLMKQCGFQLINPTEKWFPGISKNREMFSSWDWRYGKTPEFSVFKDVKLQSEHDVKIKINVKKGLIDDICLVMPNADEISVVTNMIGRQYCDDSIHNIEMSLKDASAENVKQAMGGL